MSNNILQSTTEAPVDAAAAQETTPTKLFVGSVPEAVTEDDIRQVFAKYGTSMYNCLIFER